MKRPNTVQVITVCILLNRMSGDVSAQPVISKQPTNQTASLFADATFRVTASGDAPLRYQWRFNNADMSGATNTSLTVTNVQRADAGMYGVMVSNLSGSISSQAAALTITPFNAMYCFGLGWTDTGGNGCTWPAPDYYNNRACNGPMWPQFLSASEGLPYVSSNNHAFCGATSADVLRQVSNNLGTPRTPQLALYLLWAGDAEFSRGILPDVLGLGYLSVTNELRWNQLINTAVSNNLNAVKGLYAKGARAVMIQSQFDFSKQIAALQHFGTNTAGSSALSEYCARFNTSFREALKDLNESRRDLRITWVDLFSKLNAVLENPAQYGFTKTTIDALGDPKLTDKSFTGPGADYVFWNPYDPSSKVHELIAAWHLEALRNSRLEELDFTMVSGLQSIRMNHLQIGRDYTLQKSVELRNWQEAATFTASAGTNVWQQPVGNESAVYYRLKWQP